MPFGPVKPGPRNPVSVANTWPKPQTFQSNGQGITSTDLVLLENKTPATVSIQQHSPRLVLEGQGWATISGGSSKSSKVGVVSRPVTSTTNPFATFAVQKNIGGAGWSDMLSVVSGVAADENRANIAFTGTTSLSLSNSSATVGVADIVSLANPSGTITMQSHTFAGTPKYALVTNSNGQAEYYSAGSNTRHLFYTGSSVGTSQLTVEIAPIGIYTNYKALIGGVVTAGLSDTGATALLSSYGSFAFKGDAVTTSTFQVTEAHKNLYCDPVLATACIGTPVTTACSTYTGSGQVTCESHLPCAWVNTGCSTWDNTSVGTCESGHAGCTFVTTSCFGPTDSTACTDQNNAFGGTCAFTSCGTLSTISTCNAQAGCTLSTQTCTSLDGSTCSVTEGCTLDNGGDCGAFNGDEAGCLAAGGLGQCVWDGGGSTCSGSYFSGCLGNYFLSCDGDWCANTYYTGTCSGTTSNCTGTATCSGYTTSGLCLAETGCTFASEQTITLPEASVANRGNTSRTHTFYYVGGPGVVSIVPSGANTILFPIKLYKPGDYVTVHHNSTSTSCNVFTSSTPCNAKSPCQWTICSTFNGDETSCLANGCSYSDPDCTGASYCQGNYIVVNAWIPYNINVGPNYVEKTANYVLTSTDNIVNFTTSGHNATLPSAVLNAYAEFTVRNSSGSGVITMLTIGGQLINGGASGTVTIAAGQARKFKSNATNYITIGGVF